MIEMKKNPDLEWEFWCYYDMRQMGRIFNEAYVQGLDMDEFASKFMTSDFRKEMDEWDPILSTHPSDEVLDKFLRNHGPVGTSDIGYPENCARWIGMAYAYLRYYTSHSSKDLYEALPFDEMLWRYNCGHEVSFECWADHLCGER